jgi:hypothetical protein
VTLSGETKIDHEILVGICGAAAEIRTKHLSSTSQALRLEPPCSVEYLKPISTLHICITSVSVRNKRIK